MKKLYIQPSSEEVQLNVKGSIMGTAIGGQSINPIGEGGGSGSIIFGAKKRVTENIEDDDENDDDNDTPMLKFTPWG
jgi:outer membrane lipoprotein SlyB